MWYITHIKFLALHIYPPYVVNVSHVHLSCYERTMIFWSVWYISHMLFLAFQVFPPCLFPFSGISFLYPIAGLLLHAPYCCPVVHVIHFLHTLSHSLLFIPILLLLT
jgi:hypothetical protein